MNPEASALMDRQFEGGVFHPSLPGTGVTGKIQISSSVVRFVSAKGNFELPVNGLKIEPGGASDDLIFFSHPEQPGVMIHTADQGVLNHPALTGNPALATQGRRVRTKKRMATAVLLVIAGLLVGSVGGLVLGRSWLVKVAANSVPVDWEVKAGDALLGQLVDGKRRVEDDSLNAQLKKITEPLLAGIGDNRYPLKFHIVEDPALNAFAMPGGNVVLHTGLLLAADSPEEIAGVLSHEIAHVTRRHSIRNVISSAGLYLVLQTVVGDASGLIAVLANNSAFLLDRKFSRDFEREADEAGWNYLLNGDIEPRGMITFFERMREEEQKDSTVESAERALSAISTHPATQERLDTLRAKWEKLPKKSGYRVFDLNYGEFKDQLRAKLKAAPEGNP